MERRDVIAEQTTEREMARSPLPRLARTIHTYRLAIQVNLYSHLPLLTSFDRMKQFVRLACFRHKERGHDCMLSGGVRIMS
jgi:hypothetical protein